MHCCAHDVELDFVLFGAAFFDDAAGIPVLAVQSLPCTTCAAASSAIILFAAVRWHSEFAAAQSSAVAALLVGNRGSDAANSDLIVQANNVSVIAVSVSVSSVSVKCQVSMSSVSLKCQCQVSV